MDRLNSIFLDFTCLGAKIISAGWLQSRLERLPPRGEWKLSGGRRSSSAAGLNQPAPCILFLLLICILFLPVLLLICILFLLLICILSSFRFAYFSSFRFAYSPSGPTFVLHIILPVLPDLYTFSPGSTFDLHIILQVLLLIYIISFRSYFLFAYFCSQSYFWFAYFPSRFYFWFAYFPPTPTFDLWEIQDTSLHYCNALFRNILMASIFAH